jgi:hypothetical protein
LNIKDVQDEIKYKESQGKVSGEAVEEMNKARERDSMRVEI